MNIPGIDDTKISGSDPVSIIIQQYKKWTTYRQNWVDIWQDCYELAMPNRPGFFEEHPGQSRTDRIFDSTAVISTQHFASRVKSFVIPDHARWSNFQPGPEIEEADRPEVAIGLADVEDYIFDTLQHNSNFDQEAAIAMQDLAIGMGALIGEEGDHNEPIKWRHVPLTEIVLMGGPFGAIDGVFWPRNMKANEVKSVYPKGRFSKSLMKDITDNDEKDLHFINVTIRDRKNIGTESYDHYIICLEHKEIIEKNRFEGEGSNPWVIFRWSPDNLYGRGPLLQALPDIRVANLVVELILENGEMAITGMWQYGDDTVLNPHTIQFVSGTLIPVAENSRGLEPLNSPGNFDVSQIILQDIQNKIREALFDKPLGGLEQPVRSATEVSERMAEFSRETGAPFSRLQKELAQASLRRTNYVLKKRGKIKTLRMDGKQIRLHPVSPLGRAQDQQDIVNFDRFMEQGLGRFGPQVMRVMVDEEKAVTGLSDLWGVNNRWLRTLDERLELMEAMKQAAEAGAQAGVSPEEMASVVSEGGPGAPQV